MTTESRKMYLGCEMNTLL